MKNYTLTRVLFFCILSLSLLTTRAQYVSIPDSNFGKWLNTHGYSSCLTGNSTSGWQMDTTCNAVVNAHTIDCFAQHVITDITGIQYFKHLDTLNCGSNKIQIISSIPDNLKYLDCNYNPIYLIQQFPSTLLFINCSADSLTTLPTLPTGLQRLICSNNDLSALPVLPSSLTYLDCNHNEITALQDPLPPLTYLGCFSNFIDSLPALPSTLKKLVCGDNQISVIPVLPNGLTTLECYANPLQGLPSLPNSITRIVCSLDGLTSLPHLPDSLDQIFCGNNNLTHLPTLPKFLRHLYVQHNNLLDLPDLPDSLRDLSVSYNPLLSCLPRFGQYSFQGAMGIDSTNIHCLPNALATPINYSSYVRSLPICPPSTGCEFVYSISGNVHQDTLATCSQDDLYPGERLSQIKVSLKKDNALIQQMYTTSLGKYTFAVDTLDSYLVEVDTVSPPISATCPGSASQAVNLSPLDSVVSNIDFGMTCRPNGLLSSYKTMSIITPYAPGFRPGRATQLNINVGPTYGILCSERGPSGVLDITYNGPISYTGPASFALTPSVISAHHLIYSIANLDSLKKADLSIQFTADSFATAHAPVCFEIILSSSTQNGITTYDTLRRCLEIRTSHDPNLKEVYPTTLTPDGGWLTYTIHFQNTGNDTAYTVIVRDTLDENADASSFQYLGSSHQAVVQLFGQAMVFTFPKINLVDSATNPLLSEGWIQYRVKAKPNLPLLTQVKNTAYIYFDNNAAVATNTTVNTVDTLAAPLGIAHITDGGSIYLYPNPNTGTFTLQTSNSQHSDYTITDMLGHVIQQRAITSDQQAIDMSTASTGVYSLAVKGSVTRFVVVK